MKHIFLVLLIFNLTTQLTWAGRAEIENLAKDPYVSALVVDADTGQVLFADHPDEVIYPASVLKLMVLLVILERVEQGDLKLDEMVQITKEAAEMGGSQVYLDSKEQFSVENLLYALMVQSANDAAVALATHVAGSKEGFVALMNKRAGELGMKDTHYYSVHGLPPSQGQEVDSSTAVDLAILSRELAKKKETFAFTNTREREFRDGNFIMRTHNHLLNTVDGCDGFKTGYFKAAGFSIVATAKRGGVRIIALVLGSNDRKIRDAKASALLEKGFAMVPPKPNVETVVSKTEKASAPEATETISTPEPKEDQVPRKNNNSTSIFDNGLIMFSLGFGTCLLLFAILAIFRSSTRPKKHHRIS